MSAISDIRATLRASPAYLPPCPLCSVIGHEDVSDMILTPHATKGRKSGLWSIQGHKCQLLPSGVSLWFETELEAVAWWREHRISAELPPSEDSRRGLNLGRLQDQWEIPKP